MQCVSRRFDTDAQDPPPRKLTFVGIQLITLPFVLKGCPLAWVSAPRVRNEYVWRCVPNSCWHSLFCGSAAVTVILRFIFITAFLRRPEASALSKELVEQALRLHCDKVAAKSKPPQEHAAHWLELLNPLIKATLCPETKAALVDFERLCSARPVASDGKFLDDTLKRWADKAQLSQMPVYSAILQCKTFREAHLHAQAVNDDLHKKDAVANKVSVVEAQYDKLPEVSYWETCGGTVCEVLGAHKKGFLALATACSMPTDDMSDMSPTCVATLLKINGQMVEHASAIERALRAEWSSKMSLACAHLFVGDGGDDTLAAASSACSAFRNLTNSLLSTDAFLALSRAAGTKSVNASTMANWRCLFLSLKSRLCHTVSYPCI